MLLSATVATSIYGEGENSWLWMSSVENLGFLDLYFREHMLLYILKSCSFSVLCHCSSMIFILLLLTRVFCVVALSMV